MTPSVRAAILLALSFVGCRGIVVDEKRYVASGGAAGTDASIVDAGSIDGTADADANTVACRTGPVTTPCPAGFGDCNACADDACETLLAKDSEHCGRCGRSCFGKTCNLSMCTPETLTEQDLSTWIYSLAVDDEAVYFGTTAFDSPILMRKIAKAGGPVESVSLEDIGETTGIAERDGFVYYLGLYGHVGRVPKAGGPKQQLDYAEATLSKVALDDGFMYFTSHDGPKGFVAKLPLTGGVAVKLRAGEPHTSVAIDATTVFFVAQSGVFRVEKDGTGLMGLALGEGYEYLSIDDTHVYIAKSSGELAKLQKTGGSIIPLFNGSASLAGLTVAGGRLYWRRGDFIETLPTNGAQSKPDLLAVSQFYVHPEAIAVDAEFVYWVGASRWLYRTPR